MTSRFRPECTISLVKRDHLPQIDTRSRKSLFVVNILISCIAIWVGTRYTELDYLVEILVYLSSSPLAGKTLPILLGAIITTISFPFLFPKKTMPSAWHISLSAFLLCFILCTSFYTYLRNIGYPKNKEFFIFVSMAMEIIFIVALYITGKTKEEIYFYIVKLTSILSAAFIVYHIASTAAISHYIPAGTNWKSRSLYTNIISLFPLVPLSLAIPLFISMRINWVNLSIIDSFKKFSIRKNINPGKYISSARVQIVALLTLSIISSYQAIEYINDIYKVEEAKKNYAGFVVCSEIVSTEEFKKKIPKEYLTPGNDVALFTAASTIRSILNGHNFEDHQTGNYTFYIRKKEKRNEYATQFDFSLTAYSSGHFLWKKDIRLNMQDFSVGTFDDRLLQIATEIGIPPTTEADKNFVMILDKSTTSEIHAPIINLNIRPQIALFFITLVFIFFLVYIRENLIVVINCQPCFDEPFLYCNSISIIHKTTISLVSAIVVFFVLYYFKLYIENLLLNYYFKDETINFASTTVIPAFIGLAISISLVYDNIALLGTNKGHSILAQLH